MFTLSATNPDEALFAAVHCIKDNAVTKASRNGDTLELPQPMVTSWLQPDQRVIFNAVRNANPFFHLMEALWILARRQDVRFLAMFNKRMADYSDDGETFHAPYGYRIGDQLERVIDLLKRSPDTRRAVLQIWDHGKDLAKDGKDLPCNDMVFLKIRDGRLHMSVLCRSNDMLWGAYGANVVQFSFLQEYIARSVGVELGAYHQYSDSFHVYTGGAGGKLWSKLEEHPLEHSALTRYDEHRQGAPKVQPTPLLQLGETMDMFNDDLRKFFSTFDHVCVNTVIPIFEDTFKTNFFENVVRHMILAWHEHKRGEAGAESSYVHLDMHAAELGLPLPYDWIQAGAEWMGRVADKKEKTS